MFAVKRILVPTDFGEASNEAVEYACGMARAFRAELYLLHIPGTTGENFEADFAFGAFDKPGAIPSSVATLEAEGLRTPEYVVRIGTPAEAVARYVVDREIDLIVMGTHGRTGVAHALLGSVAEKVIRTATCPVLVVRGRRR